MHRLARAAALLAASSLAACGSSTKDSNAGSPHAAPIAHAGTDQYAWKGALVTLDAGESTDPDGVSLRFTWRQVEGPVVPLSDDRAISPHFIAPRMTGLLRFAVDVGNAWGVVDSDEVIVVVQNRPPFASAGADQVAPVGNVVTLDPTGSSDPDGDPIATTWFQVSGPPVSLTPHPDGSASFVAPLVPATLEFGLVASDGEATSQADGLRVQVVDDAANWPPLARAGLDQEVPRRSVVTLDGSATDREGDPLEWTWVQTAGPTVTLVGEAGPGPSFVAPAEECDLEFQLVVSDPSSNGSDRVVIHVRNQAPQIASLALSPSAPVTTDDLVASATVTDVDGDPLTLTWEWRRNGVGVDGEADPTLGAALTTRGDVFTVRLTASDGLRSTFQERTVTIQDASPVLAVSIPAAVTWGEPLSFTVAASDPDGDAAGEIVLLYGPAGMTVSPDGVGTWTPTLPMFDTSLDVSFGLGVVGAPSLRVDRTIRVEDPSRAPPLRRSGIEVPMWNGLVAGDFDGNGTSELLVAGRTGLYELARVGSGYAQVWAYPFAPGVANLTAVEARDLDGDGKQEVFFAAYTSSPSSSASSLLVRLDGATRREAARASRACLDLEAADVDGDGTVELVCLGANGGSLPRIAVLDAATLALEWESPALVLGGSLAIGNVDEDAALEIVTAGGYVFDGASALNEWTYSGGFGMAVDTGDLDGDGIEEIVGMDDWNRFRGFSAVLKSPLWERATFDNAALLVADVDGDGAPEIVVGDGQWGNVTAYRYRPATNDLTIAHQINSQDHGVTSIAVADLDGDGALETAWGTGASSSGEDILVVAGPNPTAWTVEWMNVNPSQLDGPFYGAKVARTAAGAPPSLLFDVPETNSGYDGARLVLLDPVSGAVSVTREIGTNWGSGHGLTTVDVDADGADEAFMGTASYYDGYFVAWDFEVNGPLWTSPLDLGTPRAVTHADLNEDGVDELVGVTTDGYVYAFDVKNQTLLYKSTSLGSGYDLEATDVDGDGSVEIVALGGGRLVLFRKAPSGPSSWLESASVSVSGSDLAIADCDGDGAQELYVLGGSVTRFGPDLVPLGSFTPSNALALFIEDLGFARKNLVFATTTGLAGVDPVTGATIWRSPPLWGTVQANSLSYADLNGDGIREIAFGTTLSMYLTR